MIFKNFTKRKQGELSSKNFTIDLKRLDTYSFDKLKDYIHKYDRYSERISEDYRILKEDYDQMIDETQQLEEHNKDMCDVNIDLNNNLMTLEFKDNFIETFKLSLTRILADTGLRDFKAISKDCEELGKAVEFLLKEGTRIVDNISSVETSLKDTANRDIGNSSETDTDTLTNGEQPVVETQLADKNTLSDNKLQDSIEQIRKYIADIEMFDTELSEKMKVINRCVEGLEGDYEQMIESIENLYLRLSSASDPQLLEKYKLDDIIMISKEKLNSTTKAMSQLKKDLAKRNSEYKILEKAHSKFSKENAALKIKNDELEENIANLKKNLDSISELKNVNDSEISSHMELLKILQEENYKVNVTLQEYRTKNLEQDKSIFALKDEKKKLEDKLNDIETKNISTLRQERLKYEHLKRDLEVLEEKCRDYEMMLKAENAKYETLYKKYKELNHENYQNLKNLDNFKKVTNSFDDNDKPNRNKTNTSTNSTVNKSLNERMVTVPESSKPLKKFVKKDEEIVQYKEEIEDLKLKVVTSEVHLATERNIFSQVIEEKNTEIESLQEVSLEGTQ